MDRAEGRVPALGPEQEPSGTFDVWVESEAEVVEFLGSMAIRWEQ
ncbi:hypothetical protein [Sorangium sp. So ce1099]